MEAAAPPAIHLLGIRHHGPGSALRLLEYLKAHTPDVILLECPADAQEALGFIADPGMKPPVALLLYDPEAPDQAAHLPFARFSPEWVALRFADSRRIPVLAMDLPMSLHSAVETSDAEPSEVRDPFEVLARENDFTDTERWWEYFFEQQHESQELFSYIAEIMTQVRAASPMTDSHLNQLREAWMRRTIRTAAANGYSQIAVVCGAFHVPGLQHWAQEEHTTFPKEKRKRLATWVPWTYRHMAYKSGYAAGVLSPAWYELLFDHREEATAWWMVQCAQLARKKGLDVPPASLPHAWEMAQALANLRQMQSPGIREMEEAALGVFFQGDAQWLIPIREKLMIGDTMGRVPASVPMTPIQTDFQEQVKKARLRRTFETTGKVQADLDLRKKSNLLASTLLHRLDLLGIPWGQWKGAGDRAQGNFRERWQLEWNGWYTLRLLECGAWGSTLEEAAHNYTLQEADKLTELAPLSRLLQRTLRARLTVTAAHISTCFDRQAAESHDVWDMTRSLTPLVQMHVYGEAYDAPPMDLATVLEHFTPRILVGLQDSIRRWSDDQVTEGPILLQQLHLDLRTLGWQSWIDDLWIMALGWLESDQTPVYMHGAVCRLLLEVRKINEAELLYHAQFRLRPGENIAHSADWVSGLLSGSESLLLRLEQLWVILDHWIAHISDDEFVRVLPVLRRIFSDFSGQARRQLGYILRRIERSESTDILSNGYNYEIIIPNLTQIQNDILLPRLKELLQLQD